MKNLKIGTRLSLLLGLMSLLLILVGGVGLQGLGATRDALQTVYEDRTVALGQIGSDRRAVQGSQVAA